MLFAHHLLLGGTAYLHTLGDLAACHDGLRMPSYGFSMVV